MYVGGREKRREGEWLRKRKRRVAFLPRNVILDSDWSQLKMLNHMQPITFTR